MAAPEDCYGGRLVSSRQLPRVPRVIYPQLAARDAMLCGLEQLAELIAAATCGSFIVAVFGRLSCGLRKGFMLMIC